MSFLNDYKGLSIRLSSERQTHILSHPYMASMLEAIDETLLHPEFVVQSKSDATANLYYRYYSKTAVGGKFLCVVVKVMPTDAFVLTAYLTDKIIKGELLWQKNKR